jgi:hypoxanthine phosphoribosyltransferase
MRDYREFLSEVLVTEEQLQKRIAELGEEISADYVNKKLLLVCILKGGVVFMVDLMRHITIPHAIEFMVVSTYGTGARESTGRARILLDLDIDISDFHVLLVEDIFDSGFTIKSVLEMLSTRKPASLEVCVLLDKSERREVDIPIRYRGFTIPNKFVFGYGLDMDEYYRNLPFVGVVDLSRFE